jgi:hypothetical protein
MPFRALCWLHCQQDSMAAIKDKTRSLLDSSPDQGTGKVMQLVQLLTGTHHVVKQPRGQLIYLQQLQV